MWIIDDWTWMVGEIFGYTTGLVGSKDDRNKNCRACIDEKTRT